ncbi:hypothetical protein C8R44DRAFT_886520 [Mycena epipterygia]|nr:hypothetical protein C8R44DRAFT_886520 [Mycena epipterygia]
MHTTSTTVLTVQLAADALATVANTASTTKEAVPVNHSSNGPTCAHCGWRGGGHAVIVGPQSLHPTRLDHPSILNISTDSRVTVLAINLL